MILNKNRKGGAAIVAVLIVILLVCAGTAALIITGRKTIAQTKPANASSAAVVVDDTSSAAGDDKKSEKENKAESFYPVKADNYKEISGKGLSCKKAVLINASTNEIIAGKDYDQKMYPASLTKMLTLLVAAENIKDLDDTYTFTSADIDPIIRENASRAGFAAGEKVTARDLLYSAILVSGADGTTGLAKLTAGSKDGFVKLMNQKIKDLGLTGTYFVNASGLHDSRHYSTPQDLAVITRECLNNEICKKVLTTRSYRTSKTKKNPKGIVLTSIFATRFDGYYVDVNKDGKGDAKVCGGKTGFTNEAMYTLSSICYYKNNYYIAVTAKSQNSDICTADHVKIYEKYLPK